MSSKRRINRRIIDRALKRVISHIRKNSDDDLWNEFLKPKGFKAGFKECRKRVTPYKGHKSGFKKVVKDSVASKNIREYCRLIYGEEKIPVTVGTKNETTGTFIIDKSISMTEFIKYLPIDSPLFEIIAFRHGEWVEIPPCAFYFTMERIFRAGVDEELKIYIKNY